MAQGEIIYSPIAHMHPIAVRCDLPRDWGFWQRFDREMLEAAGKLRVMLMDGWRDSRGIAAEIAIAREMGKTVEYVEVPDSLRMAA